MFLNCPKLISTCRSSGGRSFQILGPATEKSLSPKLFCVRETTHVLYDYYAYSCCCDASFVLIFTHRTYPNSNLFRRLPSRAEKMEHSNWVPE